MSILQSAHKQGSPSFHFHAQGSERRYPCTQTASAVPKYFPCVLQFCTGYRIWHAPRAWNRKTVIFTPLQLSRYTQHFFAIFRRISFKMTSDLFTVVWAQQQKPESPTVNLTRHDFCCCVPCSSCDVCRQLLLPFVVASTRAALGLIVFSNHSPMTLLQKKYAGYWTSKCVAIITRKEARQKPEKI